MNDKEMVMRAKKDISAFDALYEEYMPRIFRFVKLRVQQRDVAEEIVSNVFFKAMSKINLFRWQSIPFSAWLYRIAISEISNYFRKEKKIKKIEDVYIREESIPKSETNNFSLSFIHKYINELSQKDQDLITLRFFEKKSFAEISAILGKKENTLRVNIHRALKKLENLIPQEVLEDVYRKVS